MERDREERRNQAEAWGWGLGVAAAAAAAAAFAGGIFLAGASTRKVEPQVESPREERRRVAPRLIRAELSAPAPAEGPSWTSLLSNVVENISLHSGNSGPCPKLSRACVPADPVLNNLNALLEDIYVRFIALKREDCELYYGVFCDIFKQITAKMNEKQIAGSHFDGLRIKKPDEYDMDIVIGLPVSFKVDPFNPDKSDIVFENKSPGYVQLKMGEQFVKLPYRDGQEWQTNRAAYEWMDERSYLLRSRFIQWFRSVVARALNKFPLAANGRRCIRVGNTDYTIYLVSTQASPAVTCLIEHAASGFKLDVDFVPTLKFPESRWPICRGYRSIPAGSSSGDWMVVPKVNKTTSSGHDQARCWRLALHDQEKNLMHDLQNMKQTLRLMKKLRDSQGMREIASYYIKTLFLWEITERNDRTFWRNNPGFLFHVMVVKLHQALLDRKIPYFWHKENNLIGHVPRQTLDRYAKVLDGLLEVLADRYNFKKVAKYLLSCEEYAEYNHNFLRI